MDAHGHGGHSSHGGGGGGGGFEILADLGGSLAHDTDRMLDELSEMAKLVAFTGMYEGGHGGGSHGGGHGGGHGHH